MAVDSERIRGILIDRLESLHRAGVMQLPRGVTRTLAKPVMEAAAPALKSSPAPREDTAVAEPLPVPTATAIAPNEEATMAKKSAGWTRGSGALFENEGQTAVAVSDAPSLKVLQEDVVGCTRCSELASQRTQTVFGVGDTKARLCFMGEAPGADEDRLGEPFVGRAGQLLTKIIEACKLKREDVYILNMIKCRPPGNRNPLPTELANCRPFLERQLELIQPEFICCLGAVAAQNLLNTTTSISRLRGRLHAYRGAKVVCTFHPAYLLRNPAAKKDAWDDMRFLMCEMGVEL